MVKPPAVITLQITESCNLRCKMCYFYGTTGSYTSNQNKNIPKILKLDLINSLVEELKPFRPFYSLFGGEPFTHPDIEEIVQLIKSAGSSIETPTNGTLLPKVAEMLVRTQFDLIRVSLDGPREINDAQRGKGSYDKAIAGIKALHETKLKAKSTRPRIGIIYTITPTNYTALEKLFFEELDLSILHLVDLQMENFITEELGNQYAQFLKSEFNITSNTYFKGLIRSPKDIQNIDVRELSRQVENVSKYLISKGINITFSPPTFSIENLSAYLKADWNKMTDIYRSCRVPWLATDITAAGDVAPCHIFYDLTFGNLYQNSFMEIWSGEKFQRYRNFMKKNKFMPICPGCCILYIYGVKGKRN